jgi:hypothetical protein
VNDIFISYDLIKPHKDYTPLIRAIERMGGRRNLLSVWEFQSSLSATQVRNILLSYIDEDDRLLVMEVVRWAGVRLIASPSTTRRAA